MKEAIPTGRFAGIKAFLFKPMNKRKAPLQKGWVFFSFGSVKGRFCGIGTLPKEGDLAFVGCDRGGDCSEDCIEDCVDGREVCGVNRPKFWPCVGGGGGGDIGGFVD